MEAIRIPLHGHRGITGYALVDPEDAERVLQHRWRIHRVQHCVYAVVSTGELRDQSLHRMLLGAVPGDKREIDHANGDGLDNCRANIRFVTHQQNIQNRRKHAPATSKYRGVFWESSSHRWVAQVKKGKAFLRRARFTKEIEAAETAAAWRRELMPFSTV